MILDENELRKAMTLVRDMKTRRSYCGKRKANVPSSHSGRRSDQTAISLDRTKNIRQTK